MTSLTSLLPPGGIPGLGLPGMEIQDALEEKRKEDFWEKINVPIAHALLPIQSTETEWSPAELQKRVVNHFYKQMLKFDKDPRIQDAGCPGAMLAEFVEAVMGAVAIACYEKPWFGQVDWTGPLYAASLTVFKGRKLFARITGARFQGWIVEAFSRWNEEQRIEKVLWDTVQASGLPSKSQKDIHKNLSKSYNEAHHETTFIAPANSENPEMIMLQDFIKYWLRAFICKSYTSLTTGVQGGRQGHISFTGALFQTLASPDVSCLPHDLTAPLTPEKVSQCWQAVAEQIESVWDDATEKVKSGKWELGTWQDFDSKKSGWQDWSKKETTTTEVVVMDPVKAQLVERIKNFQKADPHQKEAWHNFCGQSRDPARHSSEKLQEFVILWGVP